MNFLLSIFFLRSTWASPSQRKILLILRFLTILLIMIAVYGFIFQELMWHEEGRKFSFITGVYWVVMVMCTISNIGFHNEGFTSEIGHAFTIFVLVSGVMFCVILLPFILTTFFFLPWLEATQRARTPKQLPETTKDHIIFTANDPVSNLLMRKLDDYKCPYVLVVSDIEEALRMHEMSIPVFYGKIDRPQTYELARIENALMVVATGGDYINTNVVSTVREVASDIPIVALANSKEALDILKVAGSSHVFYLAQMIGERLARHTNGLDASALVIGTFDELQIAEAAVNGTMLEGKTIKECKFKEKTGVDIFGIWERGILKFATPDTHIEKNSVLLLAGTEDEILTYNQIYSHRTVQDPYVIIIGNGRIGQITANALINRGINYQIIERDSTLATQSDKCTIGDAADRAILEQAGIQRCSTIIITTNDDDLNTYLVIYYRQIRPDIQILTRGVHKRNIASLHRAGADLVVCYALLGTTEIFNCLDRTGALIIVEGLQLCESRVPKTCEGLTIEESGIERNTGCFIVGLRTSDGLIGSPSPNTKLTNIESLILILSAEDHQTFVTRYGNYIMSRVQLNGLQPK